MLTYCAVDGCKRTAFARELCMAHLKRVQRDKPVATPLREYRMTPRERVRKAAIRLANAETNEEFRLADELLRKYSTWKRAAFRLPEIVQT